METPEGTPKPCPKCWTFPCCCPPDGPDVGDIESRIIANRIANFFAGVYDLALELEGVDRG